MLPLIIQGVDEKILKLLGMANGPSDLSGWSSQPKASFEEDATIPDVAMEEISGEEATLRDVLARYKGQAV